MNLKSLYLKNFRLHKEVNLDFSGEKNYIIGGNGQGKTSILEAIYYLCTTKSFIAQQDSEVVQFGTDNFEAVGEFQDLTDSFIRIYFDQNANRKYCFIDEKQLTRSTGLIGKFPVVILTPADHAITQGSPSDRRKFIDSVIAQASSTYLKILLDYNKTLRHRASLLSQLREVRNINLLDELDAWSARLAALGAEVIRHRIEFLSEFNSYVTASYETIIGSAEVPSILYDSSFAEKNAGEIESVFLLEMKNRRNEEIRRASNLIGPHRDDFLFEINRINLKKFGSQGQNKTFQINLRFAQFFFLKDKTGRKPIFLMDDVFGELDSFRAHKISSYLEQLGQTFITLTDFADLKYLTKSSNDGLFRLQDGKIQYE